VCVIDASIARIRDKKQLVIAMKTCKEMSEKLLVFARKIEIRDQKAYFNNNMIKTHM
jgi:hypothetical protein